MLWHFSALAPISLCPLPLRSRMLIWFIYTFRIPCRVAPPSIERPMSRVPNYRPFQAVCKALVWGSCLEAWWKDDCPGQFYLLREFLSPRDLLFSLAVREFDYPCLALVVVVFGTAQLDEVWHSRSPSFLDLFALWGHFPISLLSGISMLTVL